MQSQPPPGNLLRRLRAAVPRVLLPVALLSACASQSSDPPSADIPPNNGDPLYAGIDAAAYGASQQSLQATLETVLSDRSRPWEAPDRTVSGFVTPLRTFKNTEGQYCREYRMEVLLSSEARSDRRIACRSEAGRWIVRLR